MRRLAFALLMPAVL
jgi:hypothetical protein